MSAPPADAIVSALDRLAGEGALAIACSGGGDSLALLLIATGWAHRTGRRLHVLTVDHGLRSASTAETGFVAETARRLGWPCDVLTWTDACPGSGLQARARQARHRLLALACRRLGLSQLALAHTRDDQAETLCLRLAAGGSWRSAAAMAERAPSPAWPEGRDLTLLRPCLEVSRSALRARLKADGQAWIDDPSNEDAHYSRIRMRGALTQIDAAGFDLGRFTALSTDLRAVLDAERRTAWQAAQTCLTLQAWGGASIERTAWARQSEAVRQSLLEAAVMAVSGQPLSPSRGRLLPLDRALLEGKPLSGCGVQLLARPGAHMALIRDRGAVRGRVDREAPDLWTRDGPATQVFDGRFEVADPASRAASGVNQADLEWGVMGDTYEGLDRRAILEPVPGAARSGLLVARRSGRVVEVAGLAVTGDLPGDQSAKARSLVAHRFCRRLLSHGAGRWFDEPELA